MFSKNVVKNVLWLPHHRFEFQKVYKIKLMGAQTKTSDYCSSRIGRVRRGILKFSDVSRTNKLGLVPIGAY